MIFLIVIFKFFMVFFINFQIGKNARFAKLRRWLKGVNIFQKAYVFLPIHGK